MNVMDFLEKINKGQSIDNIIMLTGKQEYLKNVVLSVLKDKYIDQQMEVFNYSIVNEDATAASIIADVQTLPAMSELRIVLARNPKILMTKGQRAEEKQFLEFLPTMSQSTIIILWFDEDAKPSRTAINQVKKLGSIIECDNFSGQNLQKWITRECKVYNKKISNYAIDFLIARVGEDMNTLSSEVKKLVNYAKDEVITEIDVEECSEESISFNVFSMIDNIMDKNHAKALSIYAHLKQMGENDVSIMMLIQRNIRIVCFCKQLENHRLNSNQIGELVGVNGYFVKKYIAQGQKYDYDFLIKLFNYIVELETLSKSSRINPTRAVQIVFAVLIAGETKVFEHINT